jgi:hypothetical protein
MDKFTTNQFAEETTAADIYEMREEHRLTEEAKVEGRKAGLSSYRTWASVNDNPNAKGTEQFSAWAESFKQAQHESNQDHDDSYLDH